MADYVFYTTQYKGDAVTGAEFPRLVKRAGEVLARYKRIYTVTAPDETAEDMALCAMVDAMAYYETAENGGGAVSSASIGNVSVSYGAVSGVDLSERAQSRELYRCASLYLDIYRGSGR